LGTEIELAVSPAEDNNEILQLLEEVRNKIAAKGQEYGAAIDPLLTIKTAARLSGKTPMDVINSFMLKHETSLHLSDTGQVPLTTMQYSDKATDLAVYYLLKVLVKYECG